MVVESEEQITGEVSRAIRKGLKMTQAEFWPPVCVQTMMGSNYERAANPMPAAVRRLVYLHYVVGLNTCADQDTLAIVAAAMGQAKHAIGAIQFSEVSLERAIESLKNVREWLEVAKK